MLGPMTDTFTKDAEKKLTDLVAERNQLRERANNLDKQISSLQMFVSSSLTSTASFSRNITSRHPAYVTHGMTWTPPPPEKMPKFRGKKITAILKILEQADDPLTLTDIISRAQDRGLDLDRDSLRSQLARVASKGRVEKRGDYYLFVTYGPPTKEEKP